MDGELLKAQYQFWGATVTAVGTIAGALIVGIFGALISGKHSREKDRQDKEAQWRNHAIELTKLNVEQRLKAFEKAPSIELRPPIQDFLANYRDLIELDKVHPKALSQNIAENRTGEIGNTEPAKTI